MNEMSRRNIAILLLAGWLAPAVQAADEAPSKFDRAVSSTEAAVKHAAEKTGAALEKAADKTGQALKKAAHKTGEALEKTGHKIQEKTGGSS